MAATTLAGSARQGQAQQAPNSAGTAPPKFNARRPTRATAIAQAFVKSAPERLYGFPKTA